MPDPIKHGQMMNYLTRPSEDKKRMRDYFETNDPVEFRKEFNDGGRIKFGRGGKGASKQPKYVWEKLSKDPLFEKFWKEQIDIANDPSISPKEYERSKSLYTDLKKVIDKYKVNDPEQIFKNFQKETRETESIKKYPNIEKNKGKNPLLSSRSHLDNLFGKGKKFEQVYKTNVSPTGQKLLTIDEFAKKINYPAKQIEKLLSVRLLDAPKSIERFTQKGMETASNIQAYNKLITALDEAGIKITYPKNVERIEREGSRGAKGIIRRGAGKIRIEATPEQIKNFKIPFSKKNIFSGEMTPTKQKNIYSSLSKASEEYKKFGYSKDRTAVDNLKKALNNTLRAMSTDELVEFINKHPKLKHIVETTFNTKTGEFEKVPVEDLAKAGILDRFKIQGFFEVDHIRGKATVDYDPATKKILDGLNLEYPKNLTIIPKGLNLSTKQVVENFVENFPNSPVIKKIDKYFKDAGITYYDRVNKMYRGADPKLGATGMSHLGLENDIKNILLNKKTFIGQDGREKVIVDRGEKLLADLEELAKIRKEEIDLSNVKPGEKGFIDKQLLTDITQGLGKGADKFLFRPLTAIEAPTLAIPQSAYAAGKLARDVAKGQETDVSAIDITLPTAVSSLAAGKKFGLDLFADNAGKVKRFLRGPFTQSGVRALSRGSLFATPFIETAIQGYNARQALLKAREKYGTDDMVPTAVGMAPREYVRDLAIENQKFEGEGLTPFSAAGGGIAKLAGDRSGAMLRSMNPDSQGLSGLLKRGKKI